MFFKLIADYPWILPILFVAGGLAARSSPKWWFSAG
jgi:hypothetical protein